MLEVARLDTEMRCIMSSTRIRYLLCLHTVGAMLEVACLDTGTRS